MSCGRKPSSVTAGSPDSNATNAAFRVHTYFNASPDVNFNNGNPTDWAWIADPIYQTEPQQFYVPIITDPVVSGTMFCVGTGHVWRTKTSGMGSMTMAEFQGHCNEFTGDFTVQCGDWQPGRTVPAQRILWRPGRWRGSRDQRATSTRQRCGPATAPGGSSCPTTPTPQARRRSHSPDRLTVHIGPGPLRQRHPGRPGQPLHAWISYSGYTASTPATPGHVFSVTYDPVAGTATWTSIDNGLGDLPTNDIALDKNTGDLYLATDFTVLRLEAGSSAWVLSGANLPNVEVAGITIDAAHRQLLAATHGRGAYRLQLS